MIKKVSPRASLVVMSFLFAILSVFFIVFALINLESSGIWLLIICGIILLGIAVLIWYILAAAHGKKVNFFLYDKKTKKELPLEKLNFDIIEARLNLYFSLVISTVKQNPVNFIFHNFIDAKIPEQFLPLFTPYLFWYVVKNEIIFQIDFLFGEEKSTTDFVENELYAIGATEISRTLQSFRADYRDDKETARIQAMEYFKEKREYLENVIQNYIVLNIDEF